LIVSASILISYTKVNCECKQIIILNYLYARYKAQTNAPRPPGAIRLQGGFPKHLYNDDDKMTEIFDLQNFIFDLKVLIIACTI